MFSNEWDKYACLTCRAWYGDEDVNSTDVRMLDVKKILFPLMTYYAGFPCQPFYCGGFRKRSRLVERTGSRTQIRNLFERIMDIVDLKDLQFFFLKMLKTLDPMIKEIHGEE